MPPGGIGLAIDTFEDRRYAPDMKNLEMRSEVNVKVKVTQDGIHHSAIPR